MVGAGEKNKKLPHSQTNIFRAITFTMAEIAVRLSPRL
jgi:hypothetical protein